MDLLSASELLGGERFDRAWMLVEAADAGSGGSLGVSRDLYVPCGVAAVDIDVFLIGVTGESSSVRWIAGQEVERFDSFGEFFEEMISYNEETLEELRLDPWLGAG
ncbi:hypothetical protein ABZ883_38805 [Streptomyces sp. NPDC046977]|uniref:hypothetical protein n=1 Tax=Streptomyces sp. NPDC046977 TaxID=3154703 RepID=UPI0033E2A2E9